MGPDIHPRLKKPVGQRLGLGAMQTVYEGGGVYAGVIAGCTSTGTAAATAAGKLDAGAAEEIVTECGLSSLQDAPAPHPTHQSTDGTCASGSDCAHLASSTNPPCLVLRNRSSPNKRHPAADHIADVVLASTDVIIVQALRDQGPTALARDDAARHRHLRSNVG